MMLAESAARFAATLLAIAQTRIELAATEIEEESLRYFSCLLLSLTALFFLGAAVMLGSVLLVVLYWDSHRIGMLLTLTAAFAIAGAIVGMRVRSQFRVKPKLLTHTTMELARDREMLQSRT
jgi:uncharacterized membrane protein YqjE